MTKGREELPCGVMVVMTTSQALFIPDQLAQNNPTQAKRRLEGHPKIFLRVGAMTRQKSPWMRGPEGRLPNVSPARKGWEFNPEDGPSAVGAALNRAVSFRGSRGIFLPAALEKVGCAVFCKENRMKFATPPT